MSASQLLVFLLHALLYHKKDINAIWNIAVLENSLPRVGSFTGYHGLKNVPIGTQL